MAAANSAYSMAWPTRANTCLDMHGPFAPRAPSQACAQPRQLFAHAAGIATPGLDQPPRARRDALAQVGLALSEQALLGPASAVAEGATVLRACHHQDTVRAAAQRVLDEGRGQLPGAQQAHRCRVRR